MAEDLLQEVLRPAVQAFLPTGRAQGGKRGAFAQRGPAHALGRKRKPLAGGGGGVGPGLR